MPAKSPDDAKRDEVLKKMLQTKPQPRKPIKGNAPKKGGAAEATPKAK